MGSGVSRKHSSESESFGLIQGRVSAHVQGHIDCCSCDSVKAQWHNVHRNFVQLYLSDFFEFQAINLGHFIRAFHEKDVTLMSHLCQLHVWLYLLSWENIMASQCNYIYFQSFAVSEKRQTHKVGQLFAMYILLGFVFRLFLGMYLC